MINIKCLSRNPNAPPSPSNDKKWKQILNFSKLVAKHKSTFPEVKKCRLRSTFAKLESPKNRKMELGVEGLQGLKASFLLDKKQGKNRESGKGWREVAGQIKQKEKGNKNQRYKKNSVSLNNKCTIIKLNNTIDVVSLRNGNKVEQDPQAQALQNSDRQFYNTNKNNSQFNSYLKQIVLKQKASIQIQKMCSIGKGVDISDRIQFQKLQRMRFSILNNKLEDKDIRLRCQSTKINFSDSQQAMMHRLPVVSKNGGRIRDRRMNHSEKFSNMRAMQLMPYDYGPWESDEVFGDIQ